jgi:hypothetical protein
LEGGVPHGTSVGSCYEISRQRFWDLAGNFFFSGGQMEDRALYWKAEINTNVKEIDCKDGRGPALCGTEMNGVSVTL